VPRLQTVLVFSQDGGNPDVARLIEGVNFTRAIRLQHYPPYLGIPSYFVRTGAWRPRERRQVVRHVAHPRGLPPRRICSSHVAVAACADAPTAANVFYLLRFAMDYVGARAAIVLESDLILAPDGLDYFRWAYESVSHSFKWRHK